MAQPIDAFARHLGQEIQEAVLANSASGYEKRTEVLWKDYADPNALRKTAGLVKQHTLENLPRYLEQAEEQLRLGGAEVHYATGKDSARQIILDILREENISKVVKSKSMATEEVELNPFLEENGIESLETDLGEFIVQIDDDHPSHIVKPIIHKNRREIALAMEKAGLGEYDDEPEVITRRARLFMRKKYMEAEAGITGANFLVAESGRLVLVTNEGNSRFCLAPTRVHIALVGIEKILPRDRDLGLFLNLLGRSGTGQRLTVYTEFIRGPKATEQPDGPEKMHVILLDNQRSSILASDCRSILRCIRCGACLNVCPVYRQASGHGYRSVYPGPVGAVLTPLLAGENFADYADLPKASSLCGACNEVCPVDIPIPDLLLRLRDRAKKEGIKSPGTPPMGGWAIMASKPFTWQLALRGGAALNVVPHQLIPVPALRSWESSRKLPPWRGGGFRRWWKKHQRNGHGKETNPS